ncbi:Gfo/Idh/MocA family protein [Radiobacillus deserti]|uniref:Gfo/Idh/MocA family oxidoreductase n=1 Tax=Radiobacillus deserti TaxID=2594883 RepID=A0A516KCE6_9BACI|nr:Gfo/Idh/MocA family oxidoreductase [Radiobacillus deserti]QDP39016.1 Gfo/Idh/MocA family oxidoreductase [Radiobacillus deserti]
MKVGVIGIGDIAKKAYLPVLSQIAHLEICLCTRNDVTLKKVKEQYGVKYAFSSVDDLIAEGIHAAFVHSSTASHEQIIDQLLDHDIHVYVDKPITYDGVSSIRLMEKAKSKGLVLMVGFNRRFAPPYQSLKTLQNPNMVLMKKNRGHQAAEPRTFIFDDFIHVIDTILHHFPFQPNETNITVKMVGESLHSVVLQLQSEESIAIGIMNREAGTTEERLEVTNQNETRIVENVSDIYSHKDKVIQKHASDDWEPTLQKRGFFAIVNAFLTAVMKDEGSYTGYDQDLETHLLAEKIVKQIEGQ